MPLPLSRFALAIAVFLPMTASANRIDRVLEQRFAGDWTGACVVAAVVDGERVETGRYCADDQRAALDGAFEIGSITKTMNAALLSQLAAEGKLGLDDPLSNHVPAGTRVPERDGKAVTLRHLALHTAGLPPLPPGFAPANPADPYVDLTPDALFAALGRTTLDRAPGERRAYSNFGAMLLSAVVAKAAGGDYDAALRERLFGPLGMAGSGAARLPAGVRDVVGHRPGGEPVPGWRFHPALSGVGGVRATLDDMVRYAKRQLATPSELGWMRVPLGDRDVLAHEGGTGGFSSFMALDPAARRAVIVLADTALSNLGGLSDIGAPLFDDGLPVGAPRKPTPADAAVLDALVGEYRLEGGLAMTLGQRDGQLTVQVPGQPEFVLGHDSRGDFFPREFDALLTPAPSGKSFVWVQGGAAMPARRLDAMANASTAMAAPDAGALAELAGTYPLMPGFDLRVFVEGGRLMAQATGQGAFALDAAGRDRFEAAAFGIVIDFERTSDGEVEALRLTQGGQTRRAERQ